MYKRQAYGYQLGVKHQYREGMFDQVDRMLYDLKRNPASRRIMSNIYVHADLHEMNLYPCAYSLTLNVSGNTLNAIDVYKRQVVEIPKKLTKTQREALKIFEDSLKEDNYEQRKGFFKSLRDKFGGKE